MSVQIIVPGRMPCAGREVRARGRRYRVHYYFVPDWKVCAFDNPDTKIYFNTPGDSWTLGTYYRFVVYEDVGADIIIARA